MNKRHQMVEREILQGDPALAEVAPPVVALGDRDEIDQRDAVQPSPPPCPLGFLPSAPARRRSVGPLLGTPLCTTRRGRLAGAVASHRFPYRRPLTRRIAVHAVRVLQRCDNCPSERGLLTYRPWLEMAHKDQELRRKSNREAQQRRRAGMTPDERRQEWRDQQRKHRSSKPKVLHPRHAGSVDLRKCKPLEAADVVNGRAYVGSADQVHDVGLVDETTAPTGTPPWDTFDAA